MFSNTSVVVKSPATTLTLAVGMYVSAVLRMIRTIVSSRWAPGLVNVEPGALHDVEGHHGRLHPPRLLPLPSFPRHRPDSADVRSVP